MNKNQFISIEEATLLTCNFRNGQGQNSTTAEMFDNNLILDIINQPFCVSVRIYLGKDSNNDTCLILVGVDISGNDLINGLILEHGVRCPTICSQANQLNS